MARFTEIEAEKILSIYRKYLQTNNLILTEEEKKFMLKGIYLDQFNCHTSVEGILGYRIWALPMLLAPQYYPKILYPRDSTLSNKKRKILDDIYVEIFIHCLLDIWNGKVPDKALLHASLIEAGYALNVLPPMSQRDLPWGIKSKVTKAALVIKNEQWNTKHEDISQS